MSYCVKKQEISELLNTPEAELLIGIKYENEPLYAFYEVLDSNNQWWKQVVTINSQEELNKLINVCNAQSTMNLLGFKKVK